LSSEINSVVCLPPLYRFKKAGVVEKSVFLAGTIEMGNSYDWQAEVIECIQAKASIIYNPRRPDWDSSWEQSINDVGFNNQVSWELNFIEEADEVFLYLDPTSKSVISMLELGFLASHCPEKLWVCCPEGFWRKGNVEVVCNRYDIRLYEAFPVMKEAFRAHLSRVYDIYKSREQQ
jgi:hypothetical protein